MKRPAKCFTCVFFERTDSTCRVDPPQIWGVPGHLEQRSGQQDPIFVDSKSGFPATDPNWWCSRHPEFAPELQKKQDSSKPESVDTVVLPAFGDGRGPQVIRPKFIQQPPQEMQISQQREQDEETQTEIQQEASDEQASGGGNEY